jgi:hypothetical protein
MLYCWTVVADNGFMLVFVVVPEAGGGRMHAAGKKPQKL